MRYFFLIVFIGLVQLSFSQTPANGYHINQINGLTINDCAARFFDSGGFAEHC